MTSNNRSNTTHVPVIDMSLSDDDLIPLIANACSTFGFFQIINVQDVEGDSSLPNVVDDFKAAMINYFALPYSEKLKYKRQEQNARGYFDDELTKQKRDWKECLDLGVPGSRDWDMADDAPENQCLDGLNVFPKDARTSSNANISTANSSLHNFRGTVIQYFQACARLSHRLATLMAQGLGVEIPNAFLQELAETHSSYLRLNYYQPCPAQSHKGEDDQDQVLGISPHRDAGFLTVLLQDDHCHSLQVWHQNQWITVHPEPRSFTINTGDMCMLWSNGKYKAPLHRVLTNQSMERYSAPFFYNPGYHQWITSGLPSDKEPHLYHPCLYGYFRAVRFAGDLTDLGVEIQMKDYELKGPESPHIQKQAIFAEKVDFRKSFSVETYRPLLVSHAAENH